METWSSGTDSRHKIITVYISRQFDVSRFWCNCTSIHFLYILAQATRLGCHGGFAWEEVRSRSNFRSQILSPISSTPSQTYYSSVIYTHFHNKCKRLAEAARPTEH
jgi:hypothetical protein